MGVRGTRVRIGLMVWSGGMDSMVMVGVRISVIIVKVYRRLGGACRSEGCDFSGGISMWL